MKVTLQYAEKAPYLGMAIPIGSLAYDNIIKKMIGSGTFMSEATARYFLAAFYEYCAERIADDVVRISTGTVSVYPAISGSFDSEDAEFDPNRNTLYVGASLSREVRDAVAGEIPDYNGEETTSKVKISSEMDLDTESFKVIRGTDSFRVCGIDLTVPDGEDESLSLVMTDGTTKVADVVVSETDDGQRLVCSLRADAAVAVGRYKLRLVSHGIDPTAPLVTRTYPVTLERTIAPVPTPVITRIKGDLLEDDHLKDGYDTVVSGVNLAFNEEAGDKIFLTLTTADGETESVDRTGDVSESSDTEIISSAEGFWPREATHPESDWTDPTSVVMFKLVKANGQTAERRVYLDA